MVLEKVKEALHIGQHDKTSSETHTGPHSSGIANQADPRVDSDRDASHTLGGTGAHTGTHTGVGHTGTGHHTSGPHSSNLANQADPRVDSDRDGSSTLGGTGAGYGSSTGHSSTTHSGATGTVHHTTGPHSSDLANKLDPRVDSDRDGSRTVGGTSTGTGLGSSTGTGLGSSTGGYGSSTHTAGPHSSNLANMADPRVDSDRDGSHGLGGAGGLGSSTAGYGSSTTGHGSTGYGSSTTGTGYGSSTTAGPHDSNLLNKLDPRVDSDRDGSSTVGGTTEGYGSSGAGTTGGYGSSTTGATGGYGSTTGGYGGSHTAGPHSSNLANQADPRVDSDRDGSHNLGGAGGVHSGTHGGAHGGLTGQGSHLSGSTGTAGPHDSNLLNKLDPRVDSDRDGSRTAGGSGTYTSSGTGSATSPRGTVFDASTHTPSEARQILGHATVSHAGDPNDHTRRHSIASGKQTLDQYGPGHQ